MRDVAERVMSATFQTVLVCLFNFQNIKSKRNQLKQGKQENQTLLETTKQINRKQEINETQRSEVIY